MKICLIAFCVLVSIQGFTEKIGLLITATGKYISFAEQLIDSAEKYFLPEHQINYYVFTDQHMNPRKNVVTIYQKRLGWPLDTLLRNKIYLEHWQKIKNEDYLFASDADMLFVDYINDRILGNHVATIHPGFYNKRGSYETDHRSSAYVKPSEGSYYFAGGFFGGKTKKFYHIIKTTTQLAAKDLSNGFIAVWHDESYWNKYCIDHQPDTILSPSYCYPESWNIPFTKKLLARDKNHDEMRK